MSVHRGFMFVALVVVSLLALPARGAVSAGERAPTFSLPLAGSSQRLTLADEIGAHKLTVVMFISTRCPFSNGYDVRMEELEKSYGSRGVRFIGVNSNVNEPVDEIVSHAKKHGFTFPVVKDDASRTADAYGAQRTPEIFVIDASGVVQYHGRIDENSDDASSVKSPDLRNALDALMEGRPVPAPSTKAFGCSIKRG
jgi:peroxiredoxin